MSKELKKTKNPAQLVIKEIMNSVYGKTILKPIETETVVKTDQDVHKYVCFNYNYIQSSRKLKQSLIILTMSIAV